MTDKTFYSACIKCKRTTRHITLKDVVEHGDADYQFQRSSEIIECMGCEEKTFRIVFQDIENAYPTSDSDWEVPESVDYYPKYNPDHVDLEKIYHVPDVVR